MLRSRLIHLYGSAAIIAGALRAITSFIPETTPHVYLLYLIIDVALLFAVIGLFLTSLATRRVTVFAFILMFLALVVLIARDVGVTPTGVYAGAAAIFSIGLAIYAIQVLRTGDMPPWIPLAWLLSTVLGPIGFFTPGLHLFFAISGLLFGTAFVGAGVLIWRRPLR